LLKLQFETLLDITENDLQMKYKPKRLKFYGCIY